MIKELAYYKQEVLDNEKTLIEMKESGRDSYDIKRFEQVLGESYMMVPDSTRRLQQALDDLCGFIEMHEGDAEGTALNTTGKWYNEATKLVRDHHKVGNGADVVYTNVDDLAEGEAF